MNSLDIGHVTQLPGVGGVSWTITVLLCLIIDIHLRVPHLSKMLVWYYDLENHFVLQFTDAGASEKGQQSMSFGSLTSWNSGDRVRSSALQYLLHCVSLSKKNKVLDDLWRQHTDEKAVLESNDCWKRKHCKAPAICRYVLTELGKQREDPSCNIPLFLC